MCHESVHNFVRDRLGREDVEGKRVLEVGSYDVNGSPRPFVKMFGPGQYIGVDMRAGPGVDKVVDASDLIAEFGRYAFDVVISVEMLEHAEDWKAAIHNIKGVTKPGGIMLISARGPGTPRHNEPEDYWRFTVDNMREIFADADIEYLAGDMQGPGVFLRARKRKGIKETPLAKIEVEEAPR